MRQGLAGLEIEGLTLARGSKLLFRDLAFQLGRGEVLALEGPNGSGKTSLLRALAGFLAPVSGFIRLRTDGATIEDREERGSFVGWLGHQDGAKAQMTPAETLSFFAGFYNSLAQAGTRESFIENALAKAGLARVRDLPVQYLSAGQRRRLALARLSLLARPLWLLDEPLAALDRAGKALAGEYIVEHCRAGGIVVAATHESLGFDSRRLALGHAT